ncbi:MAG: tRNA pseudouridine(55) synthase TruB [Rhodospirillaceae bacterium]
MARKKRGRPINGWLVVDKPEGMTSTQLLSKVRWLTGAEKAGHGGTLDPLATGVLPIAFGQATKTVSYVMDGTKHYRFRARWGEERTTDDREGTITATSDQRPCEAEIRDALPRFTGTVEQMPPQFSALKVNGERAYNLARAGEVVALEPRLVRIDRLTLLDCPDPDHADLEVICGKGTYMRSLARDIGKALGCYGHVAALRRLAVGRFTLEQAISLDEIEALGQGPGIDDHLLPVATALDDIPALALTVAEAHQLRQGQPVALLRRQDLERLEKLAEACTGSNFILLATNVGRPVALARLEGADICPVRIFNQ